MKILNKAAQSAHIAVLRNDSNLKPYSRYPVHDTEFWETIFTSAKNPKTARKVLDEMAVLENEPCVENDRVWRNISTAKSLAKMSLVN